MGEDMFLTVEKWKDPETIFNLASICTSPRSYTGIKQMKAYAEKVEKDYGAKVFIEDIPYLAISSTVIRNCVKSNNNLEEYLTTSVIKYIQDKGLYRNDIP